MKNKKAWIIITGNVIITLLAVSSIYVFGPKNGTYAYIAFWDVGCVFLWTLLSMFLLKNK